MSLIEQLKNDKAFRKDWQKVLDIIEQYDLHRAVLEYIYQPENRTGDTDSQIKQAGLDMYMLEGRLDMWEFITKGFTTKLRTHVNEDYTGEI